MRKNKPAPPSKQDAERDLHADGKLAEALRIFGERSGILAQGSGKIGTEEMEDRGDAEEQRG